MIKHQLRLIFALIILILIILLTYLLLVGEKQFPNKELWWILAFSLGAVLILIILLAIKIKTKYSKPIDAATKPAMSAAAMAAPARTPILLRRTNFLSRYVRDAGRASTGSSLK